jgi:hypothetical protein
MSFSLNLFVAQRHVPIGFQSFTPLLVAKYVEEDAAEGNEKNQQRQWFCILEVREPG